MVRAAGFAARVLLDTSLCGAECLANRGLGVNRQIVTRNDDVETHVHGRAGMMMPVLMLDEHAAAYDAVEKLLQLRRLGVNEALELLGRLYPAVGYLDRESHLLIYPQCVRLA